MRSFMFSNSQLWQSQNWHLFCLLLLTALLFVFEPNVLMGQGIVSVELSNRGDWSIAGDNNSNRVVVTESGNDIIIEGTNGTLIRRAVPTLPEVTSSSVAIPRSMLSLVRNVSIDLKQGEDRIFLFYFPEIVTGSLNCKLGKGSNQFGLFPSDTVEILNGISIRGSSSSLPQLVILGDTDFTNPNIIYCSGDVEVDLKGGENALEFYHTVCYEDLALKTAGINSSVNCASVSVEGKMNLRVASGRFSETEIENAFFGGKANLTMGNGGHDVRLLDTTWNGEVVGKFGRGNDYLGIFDCVFNHPKGASFDGGRGENFYFEGVFHSGVEAVYKNFLGLIQ